MAKKDLQKSLRIALSQCQKLRSACAECDRALKEGGLAPERYRDLLHRYHYDIQVAEAAAAKIRTQCTNRQRQLEGRRDSVRDRQAKLVQRISTKKVSPQSANDQNRRLSEELRAFDDEIGELDRIRTARNADQLGGFIDLPLDRYALLLPAVIPQASIWQVWIACVLAAIAVLAVFSPWTWGAESTPSLFQWVRALDAADEAGPAFRWSWIIWCLLPLIAIPAAIQRKSRLAGWGLLAVGLVVFAAGIGPGLAFGTAPSSAGVLASLFRLYHVGAVLYAASGIGLVYLGALRVSPSSNSLAATVRQAAVAGGILLAVMVLLLAVSMVVRRVPHYEFEAALSNPMRGLVTVVIRNNGSAPYDVAVPRAIDANAAFGLDVWARESVDGAFKAIPVSGDVWKYRGDSVGEGATISVQPRLATSLLLDLYEVRRLVPESQAVQIRFLEGARSAERTVEIPVPDRLVGPREVGRQAPPVRSPAPAPPAMESGPASPSAGEAPAAPEAAPEEPAAVWVRYTGSIGDRHIFRFLATGEEVRLEVGDELFYPWRLDAVTDSPPRVVFRHARNDETIPMSRGENAPFAP